MKNKKKEFTKNQKIVLEFIRKSNKPVKAYSILSNVSKKGLKAPPQVYRALEKLIEVGEIHKIESLNSFVACNSKCIEPHGTIFSICKSCDKTTEVNNTDLFKFLSGIKGMNDIELNGYNLELFGTCKSCKPLS
tara:strand:- start:276 stop:677 length:402 start_codon:yes stop_codon:yes gene_type:complete